MRETFIIVAVIHIAAFSIAFLKTGRGIFLIALAGFIVTALAVFTIDHFIETDSEHVERTLYELGDAMVAGDLNVVNGFISPDYEEGKSEARQALARINFSDFKIKSLDVDINYLTSPPTAAAKFFAVVSGNDKNGTMPIASYSFEFSVDLEQSGERWLITGHRHEAYRPFRN